MILEGFEIENWTCIKKLTVGNLPPTGVVVLYAPNRTGKSSMVQALRACLMDFPCTSTSSGLKTFFPRGTGEKPIVAVTFSTGGLTYRIKKCFGSNRSELATRTSTGDWKVETTSAAEAHNRVCRCTGGDDSTKGLSQLLWLTQGEFRLPDPKKFDANVQAQLRGILGILQTPLDDRFFERVKRRWNVWFSGQRKAEKQHALKDGCKLSGDLRRLDEAKAALNDSEGKFHEIEGMLRQTADLETQLSDLRRQLNDQEVGLQKVEKERERSQTRIAARQLAEERFGRAEAEQKLAFDEKQHRAEADKRLVDAERDITPARRHVETAEGIVQGIESDQKERKRRLDEYREARRNAQQHANRASAKLQSLADESSLTVAQNELDRAQATADDIASIQKHLSDNPVPDEAKLGEIKSNRQSALKLQADRDAASMTLAVAPGDGAGPAAISIDGKLIRPTADDPPAPIYSVRRKAELFIPDWGRIELTRGTAKADIDDIEAELDGCQSEFADDLAAFGIAADGADAFEQLLRRIAENQLKTNELEKKKGEFKKLAPTGLEPFLRKVRHLETKLKVPVAADPKDAVPLPTHREDIDRLKADLERQVEELDRQIHNLEGEIDAADTGLGQHRGDVTRAKENLAGFEATVNTRREELGRLSTEEAISKRVSDANRDLEESLQQLKQTELTAAESSIGERLAACKEAVAALEKQIHENEEKYNRIKGRLESSEGLHAKRASLAARVDELTWVTEREALEKDAVDRLYGLFEECRDKRLGKLINPVHDRVVNWMRVLDIGDYKEMRFGETFLPERLVRRDETAEFAIGEESTGAQELIGMLVRLALGTLLTSANEPAVAILDDPLTHCDIGRLNKMRVILRRAAEGDAKLNPPAGPLQIIILTCHPEWFRDERATVIDLENTNVMQRLST